MNTFGFYGGHSREHGAPDAAPTAGTTPSALPKFAYQYGETVCGGSGDVPGWPGASGVQVHMTNTRTTDVEVLEKRLPVLVREFSIRPGSGGRGRWDGGGAGANGANYWVQRQPDGSVHLAQHRA